MAVPMTGGKLMDDRYYTACARCGAWPAGKFAHVMAATQRTICGRCWRDLKFDESGRKIDDLLTPATLAQSQPDKSTSYQPG